MALQVCSAFLKLRAYLRQPRFRPRIPGGDSANCVHAWTRLISALESASWFTELEAIQFASTLSVNSTRYSKNRTELCRDSNSF